MIGNALSTPSIARALAISACSLGCVARASASSKLNQCDLVGFRVVRRGIAARMLHQEEMHALENPR